jgi:hypothetical protein
MDKLFWGTADEVAEKSVLNFSAEKVRRYRRDGFLKEGLHFIHTSSPNAVRPQSTFCLEAIEELFKLPLAKRRQYSTSASKQAA